MKQTLTRNVTPIRMRNYGRIIQDMVSYACTLEDPREQEALILYIAQCMRQKNLVWNRDQESGMNRVREDLMRLSEGKLNCDFEAFRLLATQQIQPQGLIKKKKR